MAYGARLESVLGASPRGFESPILRASKTGEPLTCRSTAGQGLSCQLGAKEVLSPGEAIEDLPGIRRRTHFSMDNRLVVSCRLAELTGRSGGIDETGAACDRASGRYALPPVVPSYSPIWLPSVSMNVAHQLVGLISVLGISAPPPSAATLTSMSSTESTST